MPRYRDCFPRIKKQYHHGVWRLRWRWNGNTFAVATAITDPLAESDIEALARNLASQLASLSRPTVSAPWNLAPAVVRYLTARYGDLPSGGVTSDPNRWIDDYRHEIAGKNTPNWVRDSISMLKTLDSKSGGIQSVTERSAAAYMAERAQLRSPGTHNRTLTVFKKFFSWLVNTHRHDSNPFKSIKRMKESKDTPITYCTKEERDDIITLAQKSGWPEWIAIPIAFFAGLRRSEIANLRWEHINFKSGTIYIDKTKTGEPRTLPLSTTLERFLIENKKKSGYVVEVLQGEDRVSRLTSLIERLQKDKAAQLMTKWGIEKPDIKPSKAESFKKARSLYEKQMKSKNEEISIAIQTIGWNPFRHTFATHLVQAGVSLDKVSSWMGNTPSVCRRHYARFVPREKRDDEIDKLNG